MNDKNGSALFVIGLVLVLAPFMSDTFSVFGQAIPYCEQPSPEYQVHDYKVESTAGYAAPGGVPFTKNHVGNCPAKTSGGAFDCSNIRQAGLQISGISNSYSLCALELIPAAPDITPLPEPIPDPAPYPEPSPNPDPDPSPIPSPEEPEDEGMSGVVIQVIGVALMVAALVL